MDFTLVDVFQLISGIFVCTDKDKNVILGSCREYLTFSGKYLYCLLNVYSIFLVHVKILYIM